MSHLSDVTWDDLYQENWQLLCENTELSTRLHFLQCKYDELKYTCECFARTIGSLDDTITND